MLLIASPAAGRDATWCDSAEKVPRPFPILEGRTNEMSLDPPGVTRVRVNKVKFRF